MKNKIKLLTATILLVFGGATGLQAQQTQATTGGEASGNGGTSSYTVGQMVYTTHTGTNGTSIAHGVQAPYELSVVTGIPEANGISLTVSAYPNPATDYLTVKVEDYQTTNLQYHVLDVNGKLFQTVKATGQATKIEINTLVPANYFVIVTDNEKEIKVFKIIKQ